MPKIAATLLTCAACYGLFAADLRGAEPRPAAGKADDSRPGAGKADDSRPGAGKQVPAKLDAQVHVSLNYLLYLPPGYERQDKWPLVLFLHGAGERGDILDRVKLHGPPKLIEKGKQFPFIIVSPQCPSGHWWNNEVLPLSALLDDIESKYKVDRDRVYLTGLSMGGFGTWALAGYSPNRFAAIIPICGGGETLLARVLKNMPVWAFHGGKDPVVPVKRSQDLIDALKKTNPEVKLTIYPDALHDSWTATYDNPEIYEWLLAHKRKAQP
jgi:predicted peptidase